MNSNKTYKPRKLIIEGIMKEVYQKKRKKKEGIMKDRKLKPVQSVKNILNQHHVRT